MRPKNALKSSPESGPRAEFGSLAGQGNYNSKVLMISSLGNLLAWETGRKWENSQNSSRECSRGCSPKSGCSGECSRRCFSCCFPSLTPPSSAPSRALTGTPRFWRAPLRAFSGVFLGVSHYRPVSQARRFPIPRFFHLRFSLFCAFCPPSESQELRAFSRGGKST